MPANIRSVNDNAQVVGTDYLNYPESLTAHAFSCTREGGVVNLGTLGGSYSEAVAVNNSGHVVGQSFTTYDQGPARSCGRQKPVCATSGPSVACRGDPRGEPDLNADCLPYRCTRARNRGIRGYELEWSFLRRFNRSVRLRLED